MPSSALPYTHNLEKLQEELEEKYGKEAVERAMEMSDDQSESYLHFFSRMQTEIERRRKIVHNAFSAILIGCFLLVAFSWIFWPTIWALPAPILGIALFYVFSHSIVGHFTREFYDAQYENESRIHLENLMAWKTQQEAVERSRIEEAKALEIIHEENARIEKEIARAKMISNLKESVHLLIMYTQALKPESDNTRIVEAIIDTLRGISDSDDGVNYISSNEDMSDDIRDVRDQIKKSIGENSFIERRFRKILSENVTKT